MQTVHRRDEAITRSTDDEVDNRYINISKGKTREKKKRKFCGTRLTRICAKKEKRTKK